MVVDHTEQEKTRTPVSEDRLSSAHVQGEPTPSPGGLMPEKNYVCSGKTLIEQIGGAEAAMGILIPSVEIFYTRLLSDERINNFFEGIDTERLKNKQVEFLAYVFGSPERYTGKDIAEAHKDLIETRGLNEHHFDIVAEHFHQSLLEVNVPDAILQQAVDILMTSRPIFEHRRDKTDTFGSALELIRGMKREQEKDIAKLKAHLESLGLDKDKQWEMIRGGLKMRDPDAVEYLDSTFA